MNAINYIFEFSIPILDSFINSLEYFRWIFLEFTLFYVRYLL